MTMTIDLKTVTKERHNYSNKERAILAALGGKGKRYTAAELVEKVYSTDRPLHAQASLMTMLRLLIRKVDKNKEPFRLQRTTGSGPSAHEFWLEER